MPIRHDRTSPERDDALEVSLVRALQADGRASIHELARTVGASRDAVSRRLSTLIERDGLRVVAALDPGFAGLHVLIHGLVEVDGPARPIAQRIAELPDTVFVSMVAGGASLVFESRHGDTEELSATLTAVRELPGVRRVRVTTYDTLLKEFITAASVTDIRLDSLDHDLIAILQEDGRASYRALADAVRLSPSSARARVRRLLEAGVIRIAAIDAGGLSRNRVAVGVGISLRGAPDAVHRYVVDTPAIDLAAAAHGAYDVIATIVGTATAGVLAVIEELRALPEVGSLETWAHLDIIKEDYTRTFGRILRSADVGLSAPTER
ncbi:Lrp/AsnC family transcriptional regulator [Cnuibacter sp. UC19_7]|uniref:Lrp/AsnC family transcriptional regulator n=1 Tax=Cnuibacter sp. UC19_7 TaxID=3350166 RepID=UPI0036735540